MTIFCIDVSPSMRNQRTIETANQSTRTITNLEYGLEVVKARVADMLLAGLKTVHCGIVLFGSDVSQNSLQDAGYLYIWEYMTPAQPTATTLKLITDIPNHLTETIESDKGDLLTAIILCDHLLGESLGKKKWKRKIVMITDAATETNWDGSKAQRDRLKEQNVQLTVVGLDFDDPTIGYAEPSKSQIKEDNERRLSRICRTLENGSTCTTALLAVPDAHTPHPRIPGTVPTAITLSIGALEPDQVSKSDYDETHTLQIECHIRKCASIVRPKSTKPMSRIGIKTEQAKVRRMNGPTEMGDELDQFIAAPADDQHDEEPVGLLQVERKYVYVPKEEPVSQKPKRKRGVDSESSSDESDLESDQGVPLREADKDQLFKAYKYAGTLVIMQDADFEEIRESYETSLQLRGFVRLEDVPRHHLLNDVSYLVPNPSNARSQLAFSAVVRALSMEGLVGLARYVGKSLSAEPKMMILIPVIEKNLPHFLMVQVPFAEDLREYMFPSLETVRTSAGKTLDKHKHLPTEEMQSAMDDFVDVMSTDDDVVKSENGEIEPWLEIEQACSPAIHYMNACLSYKLSHPDSGDLPAIHPSLKRWLEPSKNLKERAKPSLERLKSLVNVKPAVKRVKMRHKPDQNREDQSYMDPEIDLSDILGDTQVQESYTRPTNDRGCNSTSSQKTLGILAQVDDEPFEAGVHRIGNGLNGALRVKTES